MLKDLNFEIIMDELRQINKKYPDLRFGSLLQTAIDTQKLSSNVNLHDMSSKQIYLCLKKYHTVLEESRGAK